MPRWLALSTTWRRSNMMVIFMACQKSSINCYVRGHWELPWPRPHLLVGQAARRPRRAVCPSNGLANGLANCRKLVRPTNLHAQEKEKQRERGEGRGAKYAANTLGQITCTSQLTVNGKRAWQKNSYKGFYCYNWQIENCALAANAGEAEAVQLEQLPLPQFVAHSRRALASAQSQVQRLMR